MVKKTPKKKALTKPDVFREFVIWMSTIEPLRELKTQQEFAKKFGVSPDTLTDWKKRDDFGKEVKREWKKWREIPEEATITESGLKTTKIGKKVTQNGGDKKHLPKETIQKKDGSSSKEFSSKKRGPYFRGNEMVYAHDKWWVIKNGQWFKFTGSESEIEWRNQNVTYRNKAK